MSKKPSLNITDEMHDLAKQLAERAVNYDITQTKMSSVNKRRAIIGTSWPQSYSKTCEEHGNANSTYKEISQPLYEAAKKANFELFAGAENKSHTTSQAERALKGQLNAFIKNVAAEHGIKSSNFYYYVGSSTQL